MMPPKNEFIKASRKQWSSETAFVFFMAAAAVGLGNLWRFPYMVGELVYPSAKNPHGSWHPEPLVGMADVSGGEVSAVGGGILDYVVLCAFPARHRPASVNAPDFHGEKERFARSAQLELLRAQDIDFELLGEPAGIAIAR